MSDEKMPANCGSSGGYFQNLRAAREPEASLNTGGWGSADIGKKLSRALADQTIKRLTLTREEVQAAMQQLTEAHVRADKWSEIAQEFGCEDNDCKTLRERVSQLEQELADSKAVQVRLYDEAEKAEAERDTLRNENSQLEQELALLRGKERHVGLEWVLENLRSAGLECSEVQDGRYFGLKVKNKPQEKAEAERDTLREALKECVQSMAICTTAKFGCLDRARAALAQGKESNK